ncbi:MAG: phosphotransferase [Steroidobacteraceae bacterium]
MLPDELERVAGRHVPGAGKLDIQLLSHGVVNDTYRVRRGAAAYAMRVAACDPPDLGLDRAWEARVLERAAAAGLAPAVEYCDPRRGILISRWVEGRQWHAADVRRRSGISRMAELVRRIHALPMPAPARLMNAGMWIDYYTAAARNLGADSDTAAALRAAAGERLAALPSVDPVVCHSDLHTLNLIDGGDALVLLDWEYAHGGDPYWDLAGWSANNDFGGPLRHDLLQAYTGRSPTPGEYLRLDRLAWLYDYVCLLWCELYLTRCAEPRVGEAAQNGVAERARRLAGRLIATASGRAD